MNLNIDKSSPTSRHHAEAYALMWYACLCGHRERLWNSRDGVAPFTAPCPSCGDAMGMSHVAWERDVYAPAHEPHYGQRVWVSMTEERASSLAMRQVVELGRRGIDAIMNLPRLSESIWDNGHAPDLRVQGHGYEHPTEAA